MKSSPFLSVFFMLFTSVLVAQNSPKEVLFKIDEKPYFTDEFVRVYNKNIDLVKDESQKDLNQYLELFVAYKLKITKANKLGLQNGQQYTNELKSYRGQLAKNYTSDSKVTKALIEEGYNRLQKEVKAAHVLIKCDENASPEDTLKAFNQALDVRKRILSGENFEEVAQQVSQDPSAKENKGNLGYFSAFRMVYPFETAAFTTKVGEVSKPVRTKFGYHLVKVLDVRENRGEVTVAHIMVLKPQTITPEITTKITSTIKDIYSKLKQGESFEALANQFSEDKNSAPKGGVLPRFASGQLSSEVFENVAFGLKNVGEYSEPFESQFGWHIVKLIEKHPVKKLEEMERELDAKIRKDDRSRIITNTLNAKLRTKYKVVRNEKLYAKIKTLVTDKYYTGEWKLPEDTKEFEAELLKLQDKSITGATFLQELNSRQKSKLAIKPISKLVDFVYNGFVDGQLNNYYNDNLEAEFPEFANIVEEYRDGLLLFDLMEKEIWNKAKQDTIGLKKHFEINKANYQWKNRVEVVTVSTAKEDFVKKAIKLLKSDVKLDDIKTKLNTKDAVNVMIKEEILEEGDATKNIAFKVGLSEVYKDKDFYYVNKVIKVIPAVGKTFEETKGRVINDYQQFLEDNWVSELKKEFKVNTNTAVFEKLKATMKK
ncbi:MAG: peptidyl-prolyl cis-trans isomerase [Flavobacterium sp.]|nr:peptidyl-prolyl cis-trans isomerase [Flavobacterium sp.]